MLDFEIQRFTRRCAASDRELQPGEPFYSVLVPHGGAVLRRDYSLQAWSGPPDNALGWWQSRVPDPEARRVQWAPNTVMLEYFERLAGEPDQRDLLYVLTLLLIRRRIFRQEERETDADGQEWIKVFCARNEAHYRVAVCLPDEGRATEIQENLGRLLLSGDPLPAPTAEDRARPPQEPPHG